MTGGIPDDPRLDAMADRVLGESRSDSEDLDDPDYLALALTAAAAELALANRIDASMPERLEARVAARLGAVRPRAAAPRRRTAWLGWGVAAACMLVAAFAWRGKILQTPPNIEREFADLSAAVRPISLTATNHPLALGASGEMVWSGAGQRGFLTVRGLAGVDPARGVYQLWIFDSERDARYPVDGGVFTVADAARSTIVPIRPTLAVTRPTLFAVTLEPPGGVVVSDRKRLMLTGSL